MRGYVWFWLFALSVLASLSMIGLLVVDFFYPSPPWGSLPSLGYVGAMGVAVVSVAVLVGLSMTRPDSR